MPIKTVKDALVLRLDNLTPENLDRFREKLLDRRQEPQVRRNQVENKGSLVIANVMVSAFTEAGVSSVAQEILKDLNLSNEANRLGEDVAALMSGPSPNDELQLQSTSTTAGKGTLPVPPPTLPPLDEAPTVSVGSTNRPEKPAALSNDPGCSGDITEEDRRYWIEKGPVPCQNWTDSFAASERQYKQQKRCLSKSLFTKNLGNGESVPREWLLYSPSKGAAFCFVCLLFQGKQDQRTQFSSECGYTDWKHATERVIEHESSDLHRKRMVTWITRAAECGHIDHGLREQFTKGQYWRNVLERVFAVIKFLSERGLSFRGGDELFGSVNNGNYMGLLELISQFDPFLKEHIMRYGNTGCGNPSYLSSTICEEFVNLMGEKLLSEIINQIKLAKYFSISVYSTPNLSHIDQVTLMMRYVSPNGTIKERFLEFLPIASATGESLYQAVLSVFKRMDIDIKNCRGQCYDNASNMSGSYKGLQSRICEVNPLAERVPCAAHTLSLVGVQDSVNCCLETEEFFSFIQSLYNFFSRSPSHWQVLTKNLAPNENNHIETLKCLSDTRWPAHASAVKAVCTNYENILQCLQGISEDDRQNLSTRHEASGLSRIMKQLEIALLCAFWSALLEQFQNVSKLLQEVALDLSAAVGLVDSLRDYAATLRDKFEQFEVKAKRMSKSVLGTYRHDTERKRQRKRRADEVLVSNGQQNMSGKEKFSVNVYTVIVDRLVAELDRICRAYREIDQRFGFLNNIESLSDDQIRSKANSLKRQYPGDLQDDFAGEVIHFKALVKTVPKQHAREHLQQIRKQNITHVFPNVDIALRIYLTLPVSDASGERTFSKLSMVKNKLGSTMKEIRLSHLTRMSLESDLLRELEFSDVIAYFTAQNQEKNLTA